MTQANYRQPSSVGWRCYRHPRPHPAGRVEQPTQQVRRGRRGGIGLGEAATPAGSVADDAMGAHQALHPLVVHPPTAPAKLGGHPWGAVGATAAGVEAAELADQPGLGRLALRGSVDGAGGPGVLRRPGDPGRPAGGGDREPGGLLGIDTAVAGHGVDVSLTQKATVRLRRSRSIRSRACSRSRS